MNEERFHALNRFQKAVDRLQEACREAKDELDKDGAIQRFEFTFELLWKCLKITLEAEGILCKTPRESLKGAFRAGIIKNEEAFLDMLEDRNKASHIYDKTESEKIFKRIKQNHLPNLVKVVKTLKKRN